MSFWPTLDHWSVQIPLDTPHRPDARCSAPTGVVELSPMPVDVPPAEWESLEYMDWKSGGDTNFAPIASADGELDCRGFWDKGKTDKDAQWTSNAEKAPTVRAYVDAVGANFGRVRIIKLEPQDRETAIRSFHRDDNNRFNPDDEGWVVRVVGRADRQPRQLHAADGQRARRPARSDHRDPGAAAQGRPVRRRHAAAVARRGAQRHCAPVRADHQLRVRPGARRTGSIRSSRPRSDDCR